MKYRIFIYVLFYVGITSVTHAASQLNILTSFPPDLYQVFEEEFERDYPNIDVQFRNKKTTSGVKYLQRLYNHNTDIFWASAPDAFEILYSSDLLDPLGDINLNSPQYLYQYPLSEKDNHYVGFALSGYGIMMNKSYLKKHGLKVPKSWEDLAKPEYYSHLALSSPSRSGTTHLMIEMILQRHGWDKGWNLIMQMAGNVATITARSYVVPEGIIEQRFGLGLVIDFFAHKVDSIAIDFEYAEESWFLPASIALLKDSKNKQNAKAFIKFVLSAKGQKLLSNKTIARLPIDPSSYTENIQPINPFKQTSKSVGKTFNSMLSTQRYELVNNIFDHFITFQLKTLQRLWGKIYNLEKRYKVENNGLKLKQLNDLKRRLIAMPIDHALSLQPNIYNALNNNAVSGVEGFLPMPILSYKQQWLTKLNRIELALEKE